VLATDELTWVQGWVPGRLGRAAPALCGGRPIAVKAAGQTAGVAWFAELGACVYL